MRVINRTLNGLTYYFLNDDDASYSAVVVNSNGDYYLTENGGLCFERGSHTLIKKHIEFLRNNITVNKYYEGIHYERTRKH